jgi:hypothetical protein
MKLLLELHPQWEGILRPNSGEGVSFDCPNCGSSHRLCAYFSNPIDGKEVAPWQKQKWERVGENFVVLTISPSIQYPCFHGWIENGRVIDISEAPLRVRNPENGHVIAISPLQSIAAIEKMIGLGS